MNVRLTELCFILPSFWHLDVPYFTQFYLFLLSFTKFYQ